MIRNLTNTIQEIQTLQDFYRKEVGIGETFDGLAFGETVLRDSVSIQLALLQGSLSLSDGNKEFVGQAAVDLLRGYTTQVTKDGKPITTVSDRPKDSYRHFTGRGDDLEAGTIGTGPMIHMIAGPGEQAVVDAHFIDDVYVRDGEISYLNAGFDSHLNIEVICPPNVPFPHPTNQGTLDLTITGFVPNTTNTGAYVTAPVEVKLFRFLNAFHLVGSEATKAISSPEPFMLNTPYFLRYTLNVDPEITGVLKAAVTMGMFRKKTV